MTHLLASAGLFTNPDGSLSGLGTFMAWFLGISFGAAFLFGALGVLFGFPARRR